MATKSKLFLIHSTHVQVFFYKGPLLLIIPEISEFVTPPTTLFNVKIYKKDAQEWQSGNFLLFNIPGLRKSPRNLTPQITN